MADGAEPQDPQTAGASARRFSAFISYSHADEKFVRRLHRRLEAYRLPRRLLKAHGDDAARRLKPLFRDNDEMSASYDLSAAVREAIAASDHLIVVGSPASAKSDWVGREIEEFRALHGDQGILATIMAGSSETAFHPALHGRPGGPKLSPLAADFRPQGGGQRLALLRLVAALAGVHLDELVQRDAQRQVRQVAVAGVGAVAGIAVVAALAVYGLNARHDAEAQRARAGGLGEFMLSDLRKGLQAAGRTDLLTDVDKAALQAYPGENLARLSPDQLSQRAKAQHALGEDSEKRGDLAAAQAAFEAAWRSTAALLRDKPDDAQRIFTHAQSEFYVGFVNWREGKGAVARAHFEAYARLAAKLVQIDPRNDAWMMETVYAANNLGMLALRQAGDPARAEGSFRAALDKIALISARKPGDAAVLSEKSDALAWLADSQRLQGHLADAAATREVQRKLLGELMARDPRNVEYRAAMLGHDLAVARIDLAKGATDLALARLEAGREDALALQRQDPDNKNFPKWARIFELFKVRTLIRQPSHQRPSARDLAALLGDCTPPAAIVSSKEIGDFCTALQGQLLTLAGDSQGAATNFANARRSHMDEVYSTQWGLDFREETTPGFGQSQR